ncbi:MAG: hypothetical protein EOM05_04900 [Clostridia bacterium]|nr:hypothetical protein [Clostridia bacterium]
MKIKGQVKNLAPSALIIIMAIATLVAVPLRTYQIMNIIEPQTGFYAKYDISIVILYALLVVACFLIFILSFIGSTIPSFEFSEKKNKTIGVCAALFSLSLLFDSIIQIDKVACIYNDYNSTNTTVLDYFIKSGGVTLGVQSLFAILSAVYFSIFAASYFKGKRFYSTERLLALSPVIWAICRVIKRFIEPISFKNVSELLLQLFMLVFMLIFFLSLARIASKVNFEKSMWVLYASGLCSALIAMTTAVSSAIVMIIGKSSLLYSQYSFSYSDILFSIFVVVLLLEIIPSKAQIEQINQQDVELVEQTQEENEEVQ